ncbi:hypothetical protein BCM20_000100 [Clostridium beijerinckii]|nr:hypothetical protein [Clostridium beijerinckii]NYC00145.1 hypothetical protein [Clostridium beijerinckii]
MLYNFDDPFMLQIKQSLENVEKIKIKLDLLFMMAKII